MAADRDLVLGAGFFFAPKIPALLAAPLTLLALAAASYALFSLVEHIAGRIITDTERRRHVVLALAAFAAFSTFYFFAGAPTRFANFLGEHDSSLSRHLFSPRCFSSNGGGVSASTTSASGGRPNYCTIGRSMSRLRTIRAKCTPGSKPASTPATSTWRPMPIPSAR